VFFNLLFEVKPFAAIVIAHETLGRSQKFVLGAFVRPKGRNSRRKADMGRRRARSPTARGFGGVLSAPAVGFRAEHFGRTTSPENA